ncbi:MAG: class I SAM-dependent DNA methyltransferase, partial [Magnetospirillum sp.]|nr:class I SAM-dependent DNA methyltransferase [Magnetospirillum sp.]
AHPELTLTGMYNVLVKLRANQPLGDDERAVNDKGLVNTLRHLHDQLDVAVAEAYGWPAQLDDDDILARLVALNKQRWQDEIAGKIHWLRPDFQTGRAAAPAQAKMDVEADQGAMESLTEKAPWPKTLPDQVHAIRTALSRLGEHPSVEAIAKQFKGAKRDRVAEILQAMALMG